MREFCAKPARFSCSSALAGIRGLRCHAPDAGMFMLIDVRDTGLSGYDFMCELYRSEGVSVLDGGAFGEGTAGFVRAVLRHRRGDAARGVRAHPPLRGAQPVSGWRRARTQLNFDAAWASAPANGSAVDSLMTVTATDELTDRTQGMRDR